MIPQTCHHCGGPIPEKVHPYTLRIELFHAVEPSLEITQREASKNFAAEMAALIELMDGMSDADVLRQEKKIYFTRSFTLCPACRDVVARKLERLTPPQS